MFGIAHFLLQHVSLWLITLNSPRDTLSADTALSATKSGRKCKERPLSARGPSRTYKDRPHMKGPSDMRACQQQPRHGNEMERGDARWESSMWEANRQHKDDCWWWLFIWFSNYSCLGLQMFCTKYKHEDVCISCICSLQNIIPVSLCNSTMLVLEMKNVLLALLRLG